MCKNFFFRHTKIRRHYFYKVYKIFEKFDGVIRTFSISSLKFFLKLASHIKKLRNMCQVFHLRWETINLRFLFMGSRRTSNLFPTCLRTIVKLMSLGKVLRLFIDKLGTNRLFCNYPQKNRKSMVSRCGWKTWDMCNFS